MGGVKSKGNMWSTYRKFLNPGHLHHGKLIIGQDD